MRSRTPTLLLCASVIVGLVMARQLLLFGADLFDSRFNRVLFMAMLVLLALTIRAVGQRPRTRRRRSIFILTLALASSGCGLLADWFPPPSVPQTACAWQWATAALPEVTASLNAAISNAGLTTAVTASAFGENCLETDGSVRYFAAMQTDYDLVVPVTPDGHPGDALADVLAVLTSAADQGRAGSNPGRIGVTWRGQNGPNAFYFDYTKAADVVARRLRGDSLLKALEEP